MTASTNTRRSQAPDAIIPWSIGLIDGLVPTHKRIALDFAMSTVFSAEPDFAEVFTAGVLSDLILTLPVDDDLRLVSGRVVSPCPGEPDLVRGRAPQAPTETGAVLADGSRIGAHWQGAGAFADSDLEYAALADGISREAAALIAFAGEGWTEARKAMTMLRETAIVVHGGAPALPRDDEGRVIAVEVGEHMFAVATDAIRWAAHRRRFVFDRQPAPHVRGVDEFLRDSCWAWSSRTEQVLRNEVDLELLRSIAADQRHGALANPESPHDD